MVAPDDVVSFSVLVNPLAAGSPPPSDPTNICGLPSAGGCTGQNLGPTDVLNPGFFYSYGEGTWDFEQLCARLSVSGTNATWTLVSAPVPLPASVWLSLGGIAGVSALRRLPMPPSPCVGASTA